MANFAKRPQPYRLQYPLSQHNVEQLDEMLEILFKRISQAQVLIEQLTTTNPTVAAALSGLMAMEKEDGEPILSIPGPKGDKGDPGPAVMGLFDDLASGVETATPLGVDLTSLVQVGLWTPTDASGAALVFGAAAGSWVKIGPFVFVTGTVTYPVTADGSNALIGGLPFTVLAGPNWGGTSFYSTLGVPAFVVLLNNTTTLGHYVVATAAQYTNVGLSGKGLFFSGVYRTY